MTNAAAVYPLTYGATDIQQDPIGIFIEIDQRGLFGSATTRGANVTVPSLRGQIDRSFLRHERHIPLDGWVYGIGDTEDEQRESHEELCAILVALFDEETTRVLSATLPSGDVWTINARTDVRLIVPTKPPAISKVTISLISVDPDWVVTP